MQHILILGIAYSLGGASYPLLAWLLGYRKRMREQKREALVNRVIGATPRKTMRLVKGAARTRAQQLGATLCYQKECIREASHVGQSVHCGINEATDAERQAFIDRLIKLRRTWEQEDEASK